MIMASLNPNPFPHVLLLSVTEKLSSTFPTQHLAWRSSSHNYLPPPVHVINQSRLNINRALKRSFHLGLLFFYFIFTLTQCPKRQATKQPPRGTKTAKPKKKSRPTHRLSPKKTVFYYAATWLIWDNSKNIDKTLNWKEWNGEVDEKKKSGSLLRLLLSLMNRATVRQWCGKWDTHVTKCYAYVAAWYLAELWFYLFFCGPVLAKGVWWCNDTFHAWPW